MKKPLLFLCFITTYFIAFGGIIPVTSLNDGGPGTLRQGIIDAQNGDTLLITTTGTLFLSSQLEITQKLTIIGPGPADFIIDGQDSTRIFFLKDGPNDSLYLSGMTLQHGNTEFTPKATPSEFGGGAILNYGSLFIENCVFLENIAEYAGAIDCLSNANQFGFIYLELRNCSFIRNRATSDAGTDRIHDAGAIQSNGENGGNSRIDAFNCLFAQNEAEASGGAIQMKGDDNTNNEFFCTNCLFTQNKSANVGAIDNTRFGATTLANTIIIGNEGIGKNDDFFGNLFSKGFNLIDQFNDRKNIFPDNPVGPDTFLLDAGLGPLVRLSNGHFAFPLTCNSAAIGFSDPTTAPAEDIRGEARGTTPDAGPFQRNDARDILVTNLEDDVEGSLRLAVVSACEGDTLDLGTLRGTLKLKRPLFIDQTTFIQGNTTNRLIISTDSAIRLFEVNDGDTLGLSWCWLKDGQPETFGGGAVLNRGTFLTEHVTFSNNRAASGGAVASYGRDEPAFFRAVNCTFSGNRATNLDGGAIDSRSVTAPARAELIHCTLAFNEAGNKGGGLYNGLSTDLVLNNSLISQNTASISPDFFDEGEGVNFQSNGGNLFGDTTGLRTQLAAGDKVVSTNLNALDFYGGPTPTHSLNAGSPAIDAAAGSSITIDQRGEARIFNGTPDIGAYEYDPATSLEQVSVSSGWQVYPNPVTGRLFIRKPGNSGGKFSAKILDLNGRTVSKGWEMDLPVGLAVSLDVSTLPVGCYILSLTSDAAVSNFKVLVNQ
ncbi:MAG: choice-of-anchor Q domain-containing protein [Bacteroidota bacterium]